MPTFDPFDQRRPPPAEHHVGDLAAELEDTARQLARDLPELARRAREDVADGYPRRSLRGGSPASVKDDEGVPMPPVADPVGELVAGEFAEARTHDPIRAAYRDAIRRLLQAVQNARLAAAAIARAQPPTGAASPCRAHLRAGLAAPARTKGAELCQYCANFKTTKGREPGVVELQELESKRIARDQRSKAA